MLIWLRLIIIGVIILSASSFLWFLLGSTAYLQRGMDIIGTTYLLVVGIPVLLLAILFTILLVKGCVPTSGTHYIGICIGIVISVLLSTILIQSVSSHGWTKEKVRSDSLKITTDGKYEYRIDLINLFQRNSNARLYLIDIDLEEEMYISVNIQTHKIVGLSVGEVNRWVLLEPTDDSTRYILTTTKELRLPEELFEIDIAARTSRRLE
jgi:low affinity Fe/Cu permease